MKKIATLENEIESQILESVLVERRIPHLIKSYHDFAFDGLFQFSMGWGHVEAKPEDERKILDILEDIRKGEGE